MPIDFKKCREAKGGNIITPKARMSFPALFAPQRKAADKEPTYQVSLVIPPDADISLLKKAAEKVAKEKWGTDLPKKLRSPFLEAAELDRAEYEAGWIVIRADTKSKPGVVDARGQSVENAEEVYAGRWCVASLAAYAYPSIQGGLPGVKFYLQNVQVLDHDEPWAGRRSKPEDDFEPVETEETKAGGEGSAESLFG